MFFPALTRRPPASAPLARPVLRRLCRHVLLVAVSLAALGAASFAKAQTPGEADPTFTAGDVGATFYALLLEEISGSQFLFVGGDAGLAQLEFATSGTVDSGFALQDFGFPVERIVYTAVPELVTADPLTLPKVLIGGLFGRDSAQIKANQPGQNIKRFSVTDGTLDTTFNPGTGANNFVTSILPLADGTMVVGGEFDLFNKVAHERIVKLDNSGAIVSGGAFNSTLAFDATVLSLAPQYAADGSGQNGQILVAGVFSNVSGQTHTSLARINADGSIDASFNPVFSDRVRVVVSEPDGKILAGGDFFTVNGQTEKHIVRLNYDGSIDATFNCQVTSMPPEIDAPVAVNTITPFSGGRYYIGGNFAKIDGAPRAYLGAVLNDGTVDSFDPGKTLSNAVEQVVIDPATNKLYVSQMRDKSVNNVYPASIFRLFGDTDLGPEINVSAFQETQTVKFNGKRKTSPGGFTFTRTIADSALAVPIYFSLSGDAKFTLQGKKGDYHLTGFPTPGDVVDGANTYSVTFPANVLSLTIEVAETTGAQDGQTATLSVVPSENAAAPYTVGATSSASVILVTPPVPVQ